MWFLIKLSVRRMRNPVTNSGHQVSGRLHVEIERISGSLQCDKFSREQGFEVSDGQKYQITNNNNVLDSSTITLKLTIKSATGLPPSLSQFVVCQYMFWGDQESVATNGMKRMVLKIMHPHPGYLMFRKIL